MSKKIALLLAIVCLAVYSSVGLASDLAYRPGELIVRFAPKADGKQRTKAERNTVLASLEGGSVKHSYKLVPGLTLVKLPENLSVENALVVFKNASGVLYAEPNYKIKLLSIIPNDTRFDELWGMHNTGQTGGTDNADIDAPEAWDFHTGSTDIIVAVIDSGVDYTHPDLAANMWVNTGEIPGNGIDDDGNGYVDDVYGYDFADDDSNPKDYYFHGTHCAGTVGALGNNGEGVAGVCWTVKIMNLKIFPNYGEEWFISGAIEAIEYGVDKGAQVLSNSWGGGPYSESLKNAIQAADANGVLFIAAAGNEDSDNDQYPHHYPSGYDCNNIISVMATNHNDERWESSNYGPTSVDIGAPGTDILSTFPTYETDEMWEWGFSTYYETISGTSMATPHVAGACALVWSRNLALSHLEVKDIILNAADQIPALNGLCVTGGRLNVYNAITHTPALSLSKVDDVNDCVLPDDYITYTISYGNPITDPCDPRYLGNVNNVVIVDYLPEEVELDNPFDPNYDPVSHTYTWNIGMLSPGESNSVTLEVTVNELAEPLGTITNYCEIESDIAYTTTTADTSVCCWDPGAIYVDRDATGRNNGMSWDNAYTDLQSALARAGGCSSEIWVAEGTYRPTTEPNNLATFELIDGVPVYGGFAGNETTLSQRNWVTNETILSGDIKGDGEGNIGDDVDYVVTAWNVGQTAIIDGFTIKRSYKASIKIDSSSPTIRHNKITQNKEKGIQCINQSSANITNCQIQNNGSDGIYCQDSHSNITDCLIEDNGGDGIYNKGPSSAVITNNIIRRNNSNGIYCADILSGAEIKNNWIHNNGTATTGSGIHIYNSSEPTVKATVRNNTIVNNAACGINSYYAQDANVSNCIIWGNKSGQLYSAYGTFDDVTYCCIQGDTVYPGEGNIDDYPCFIDDLNDFHLIGPDSPYGSKSPCIDKGKTGDYPGETDIDGEDRVINGRVDMGADEYYWSPADFNNDEIVNFYDYAFFANAWLTKPGDGNWDPNCDINTPADNYIDYHDLAVFCEDWLWEPAWTRTFGSGIGMGCGIGRGLGLTEGLYTASPAKQPQKQPIQLTEADFQEIVNWLEELWLDEEVRKVISEDEWQKFVETVKEMWYNKK